MLFGQPKRGNRIFIGKECHRILVFLTKLSRNIIRLRKEFLSVSVSKKYKRILKVDDRTFVWYIAEDDESDHLILNIISNDKKVV